jgi:hypothetical protein
MLSWPALTATPSSQLRAYRARRQLGDSNHPAVQAALEAFRAAKPGVSDVEVSQAVVLIIARASQQVRGWFWRGVDGLSL